MGGVMGLENNIVRHRIINLKDPHEVKYWTRRLSITQTELRRLAEWATPPLPEESAPKLPSEDK